MLVCIVVLSVNQITKFFIVLFSLVTSNWRFFYKNLGQLFDYGFENTDL